MSWIDTPMVQDAKADLSSFRMLVDKLPPPMNQTTDVESCARAFVKGLENRSRRVYVPGWVGAVAKLRTFLTTPLGDRTTRQRAAEILPTMDKEVSRMGRAASQRYVATSKQPAAETGPDNEPAGDGAVPSGQPT
jgi:hypothetical protein